MALKKIGKLPSRYTCILNPYSNERISRCPLCHKLTHRRKFAFLIHIVDWGPFCLGKTCCYCTPCEMIAMHQNELESVLADCLESVAPQVAGNAHWVMGTVDRKTWKKGMQENASSPLTIEDALENMADFKKILELKVEYGGWYPKGSS